MSHTRFQRRLPKSLKPPKNPPSQAGFFVLAFRGIPVGDGTTRDALIDAHFRSLPSPYPTALQQPIQTWPFPCANLRSLHPPTSSEVFRRPDHEMPKLPVVRSRKSRVSGQPSQVAGALIPDNTQQSSNRHLHEAISPLFGRKLSIPSISLIVKISTSTLLAYQLDGSLLASFK